MLKSLLALFQGPQSVKNISGAELQRLIKERSIQVIDVRTPSEYGSGHIPKAKNLDVNAHTFSQKIGALPKDGVYVVYCRSGMRSRRAAGIMAKQGFTTIYDLGGVGNWPGKLER
ncbi:MAG: rhodanese-like domain-containing protein [Cytophagales bacterium]|nr:rhodanese-like domain-containing protein [Cytophagales bacterium]